MFESLNIKITSLWLITFDFRISLKQYFFPSISIPSDLMPPGGDRMH